MIRTRAEPIPFALENQASRSSLTLESSEREKIDLGLGEPQGQRVPFELFQPLLSRSDSYGYTNAHGIKGLRQAIFDRFYPNLDQDGYEVLVTHGAINAIDVVLRSEVFPGEEVLIPDPGFPAYAQLLDFIGAKITRYNMAFKDGRFAFDIDALESAISNQTKLIILNSPHNPTGAILHLDDMSRLRTLMSRYPQVRVLSDEVYSHLTFGGAIHHSLAGMNDRIFVANSFSKVFGVPGLRIGWILTPQTALPKISAIIGNSIGCASALGQQMVLRLLKDDYRPFSNHEKVLDKACFLLRKAGIEYVRPEGAFFLMVKVDDDFTAANLLDRYGLKVVPGSIFGKNGKGWIRICFARNEQTITDGIDLLARMMQL